MLVLNAAWFVLQIPVVTGPPATASVYAMVRRSAEGEYWGPREAWQEFRSLFWPAWRWGLLNVLVWFVGLSNLISYWQAPGTQWFALRLLWIGTLTLWLSVNFFYWPFWLAQDDRSMRNTYRNCGRFMLLHPGLALALVGLSVILTVVSLVTTLPFTLVLMCWLALLGTISVQQAVAAQKRSHT